MAIRRSLRGLALALIIASSASIGVKAEPIQSQADTERAVRNAIEASQGTDDTNSGRTITDGSSIYNTTTVEQATKIRQEMNSLLEEIQKIDSDISANEVQLQKNQEQVEKIKEDIKHNEEEIELLSKKIEENEKLCGRRMQSLASMSPQLEMLASIVSSKSISDFFNKVDGINQIISYDKQVMTEAKENKKHLAKLNKDNEKTKKTVEMLVKHNEKMKENLEEKKTNANDKVNELKAQYASLFNLNQSAGAKEVQDMLLLKYSQHVFTSVDTQDNYLSVMANAPGIYGTPDLSVKLDFTQDDIIMKATSLLGIPYVWGGTTLDGFDCSGFVQYVYRQYGIFLPRVSQDQQNVGVEVVDESQLQPGDLLFFGNPAHHVAMYVQPGYMIEAPYTGSVIKVSPIRAYSKAMRVVDWSKMVPQVTDTTQATASTDTAQVTEVSTPEVQ